VWQHPMSSVCIDVRPARLVERAAALSEPMPFSLRERVGEGAERSEEKRGPGERGGEVNALIIIMLSSLGSHYACGDSAGEKGPAERRTAPAPPPPSLPHERWGRGRERKRGEWRGAGMERGGGEQAHLRFRVCRKKRASKKA
jgi:hypothetical protein